MLWFMLIALVAVVAAVAMAVLGDGGALKDSEPERLDDRLPPDRPLVRSDIDAVRLPVAVRGYRMIDVDEVLDRLGAELAERDARIAELESSLAGARAAHGASHSSSHSASHSASYNASDGVAQAPHEHQDLPPGTEGPAHE
ncbi:DivIVA domain-containing protein [Actinacidiphila acidipaludis]|uniref:DivIVA domain-containing protein n=1 Tax=Actinacidiphila acidipaludis TaxID=2873382 RepID=A0ABS7Q1J8_9ACTN|nr:DivIVA domain-containing protein [Streptomyces acidipaludis]MBY8877012.1 DivIVA domain-containing protein [Streptomyces acidipaludis]